MVAIIFLEKVSAAESYAGLVVRFEINEALSSDVLSTACGRSLDV
jgi:hypothetical protein